MMGLSLGLSLGSRAGGDALSRYSITLADGRRIKPLFAWDASSQQAHSRDFAVSDFSITTAGGSTYSPLFAWSAANQVAVK